MKKDINDDSDDNINDIIIFKGGNIRVTGDIVNNNIRSVDINGDNIKGDVVKVDSKKDNINGNDIKGDNIKSLLLLLMLISISDSQSVRLSRLVYEGGIDLA